MRAADLATAGVLMLLAGIVLVDAIRLGIGWGTDGPKSGFFPFWLAVTAMAACVAIAAQAPRAGSGKPFVTRARLIPVVKVLAPALGLVLTMQGVGLYVASAFYLGLYMRWIGHHRWVTVVGLSVVIPLATFVVFERWFLVPMPKGPLEDWLGF